MIAFSFKGRQQTIPGVLEELNGEQYLEFLKLSTMMTQGLLTPDVFRRQWISTLLGLRTEYTIYNRDIIEEVDGQLGKLDGFFLYEDLEDGTRAVMPRLRTGKQMMKEYAGWKGPGDMLDGMTFGEFTECLTILSIVRSAIDDHADDKQIVELYNDMTRRIYHHPKGNVTPPALLVVHATNMFSAVWTQILHDPVSINGEDINFSILFNASGASGRHGYDDQTGWKGILFEVAASGVFGTVEDVNRQSFWDVLLYLYKAKYEYLHKKHH